MTTYSFVDESGETRLRGTIDPAPGGGSPQVLGPFTVTAATPDIGDGALLTLLDAGTVVVGCLCVTTVAWNSGQGSLNVALGNLDYGPPDDDWVLICKFDVQGVQGTTGVQGGSHPTDPWSMGGRLTAPGALVASVGQVADLGSSSIYASVLTP